MNSNATAVQSDTFTLNLSREYQAEPARVFKAWTDPRILTQWFGPQGVKTRKAEVDLRVGGRYRFTMEEPNGNTIEHGGVYREIDPPERLVFTWVLEGQACEGSEGLVAETLVTLRFEALGTGTKLSLTHEFLPTEASQAGHAMGWEGSLERLAENLA